MADLDRRGKHRPAVLEQKGEIGGHRRSDGEDQPEDHEKPGRRTTRGTSPVAEIARMAELREAVVDDVVELNEHPHVKRRMLKCPDVLQPCYVCAARPAGGGEPAARTPGSRCRCRALARFVTVTGRPTDGRSATTGLHTARRQVSVNSAPIPSTPLAYRGFQPRVARRGTPPEQTAACRQTEVIAVRRAVAPAVYPDGTFGSPTAGRMVASLHGGVQGGPASVRAARPSTRARRGPARIRPFPDLSRARKRARGDAFRAAAR